MCRILVIALFCVIIINALNVCDCQKSYKLYRTPVSWRTAHARCLGQGMELASPTTFENLQSMTGIMRRHDVKCGVWTGIHDITATGQFYSIDGTPLEDIKIARFTELFPQCPDTGENFADALYLMSDGTLSGGNATETRPYICSMEKNNTTQISQCDDNGYTFYKNMGSCYKFHTAIKTWPEAQKTCIYEGGNLAVINSGHEAEVLSKIFAQYPHDKMLSRFKDTALIGFRDFGTPLGWLSQHGQALDRAGYSSWSNGQPDHSGHPNRQLQSGETFCGAIFRTGQLDDIWCDVQFAFICERKPLVMDGGVVNNCNYDGPQNNQQ